MGDIEQRDESAEQDRIDAARYRWLRKERRRWEVRYWTGQWWEPMQDEAMDAAIDATRD